MLLPGYVVLVKCILNCVWIIFCILLWSLICYIYTLATTSTYLAYVTTHIPSLSLGKTEIEN